MVVNVKKGDFHHVSGIMDTWTAFMELLHRTNSDYWQVRDNPTVGRPEKDGALSIGKK